MVDPRPYAVGELKKTMEAYPHLTSEVPAMGYSAGQVQELEEMLRACPTEVVLEATPADLSRLVEVGKPIVQVDYRFREKGAVLDRVLERFVAKYLKG